MQLDQTLIAIRPRSIMDRLDLAFMLCGRHPIGIGLAMIAGIAPFIIFDLWMAVTVEQEAAIGLLVLFLPAQLSLSTVFVTLYLGQKTFQRSFSLKQALATLFRQSPSLLVYQVLFKTFLCLTVILSPVAFLSFYYINEIMLLERASFPSSWKRRHVLHDKQIGDLLSSRMAEFFILIVGGFILSSLLFAVRDLWSESRAYSPEAYFDGTIYESEFYILNWPILVAMFLMMSFLRVYRFTTYLDTRIRYEGWDVELKLRSLGQRYS